jgi:hypothetical protein
MPELCLWLKNDRSLMIQDPNNLPQSEFFEDDLAIEVMSKYGVWRYRGRQFKIGHGVRVDHDGELLPGPVFVFDPSDTKDVKKLGQIITEMSKTGRLVVA